MIDKDKDEQIENTQKCEKHWRPGDANSLFLHLPLVNWKVSHLHFFCEKVLTLYFFFRYLKRKKMGAMRPYKRPIKVKSSL